MNSGSISGNSNNVRINDKPSNQIHHAKINQRQDSNISSDSYSMMSSPGYSMKNMEAPLLQNASKMNKSKNYHPNSNDSFIMSSMSKNVQHGNNGIFSRHNQDLSNDSFNQSTPGSKLLDVPLLAHAAKINSCEYTQLNIYFT
jgi:corin